MINQFDLTIQNGPRGLTGATGSAGAAGATGATGPTGAAGATGSAGATGATGSVGATGSAGSSGVAGANGTNGTNGTNGATGATGSTGATGPTGVVAATSPLAYNSGTQTVSAQAASGSQAGYLSAADFATFAAKLSSIAYSASTPTRSLNTNFTPDASKAVLVSYSVSISCSMSLTGGQTGSVELRSDANATPTTVRSTVANANSGTLTIGLALVNAQTVQISYLVPPGHNVRLVSSGTATISIISQSEVAITPT